MASFFQTIWSKTTDLFQSKTQHEELAFQRPESSPNKKGLRQKLSRLHEYRVELEMKIWKMAVAWAEDVMRPRRNELYRVYHRAMEDEHLLSQVRTAIFTVRTGLYRLERDGQEREDLNELFARPWFRAFLRHAVETEMWGHSLLEFDPGSMQDGEFTHIDLIPRLHVRPEYGQVVIQEHDEKGIPYRKPPVNKYLIELGEADDLGLLKVASKAIIRKDYSMGDWSRRNEKYGMPTLVIRTASRQKEELDEKQRMAENFGNNLWAILDDQDEISLLESGQALTFQTFENLADRVDKSISILVNGQTGTTEEKSFVGSAEVHERVLNTYTKDRLRRIQDTINWKLIPFLTRHGYPLAGAKFKFADLDDNADMADNLQQGDEQELALRKKKSPVAARLTPTCNKVCGCPDDAALSLSLDSNGLDEIVQAAIKQVYDKRLGAGDVDADTWRHNVDQLWKAAQEGAGGSFASMEYLDPSFELLAQFRQNIQVFATFKGHANIEEMVQALVDDQGQVRSFSDFAKEAEAISANYNRTWLETEYQTAIGTAQMATKWADYESRADVLPMLKYITQQDSRVRASHAALDGTTLPINDPFWEEFYPPNGYNCRCTVQQVAEQDAVRPSQLPTEQETPLLFRHNAAKDGQVFTPQHPYFLSVPNQEQRTRLQRTASRLAYDAHEAKKVAFDEASGGWVVQQPKADGNLKAIATILAQAGEQVELLATSRELGPNMLRNGLVNLAIQKATQDKVTKAAAASKRILIALEDNQDEGTVLGYARDAMQAQEGLQEVQLLFTDGRLKSYGRNDL